MPGTLPWTGIEELINPSILEPEEIPGRLSWTGSHFPAPRQSPQSRRRRICRGPGTLLSTGISFPYSAPEFLILETEEMLGFDDLISSSIPGTEDMLGALSWTGILFPCYAPGSSIPETEEILGIKELISSSIPETEEMIGALPWTGIKE